MAWATFVDSLLQCCNTVLWCIACDGLHTVWQTLALVQCTPEEHDADVICNVQHYTTSLWICY